MGTVEEVRRKVDEQVPPLLRQVHHMIRVAELALGATGHTVTAWDPKLDGNHMLTLQCTKCSGIAEIDMAQGDEGTYHPYLMLFLPLCDGFTVPPTQMEFTLDEPLSNDAPDGETDA